MESKIYHTKSGEQVFLGEPFEYRAKMGKLNFHFQTSCLTEFQAESLVEDGILIPEEADTVHQVPKSLRYYSDRIGERMGLDSRESAKVVNCLYHHCPYAAFEMLLREIAVEIDKKYPDHIGNSRKVYTVSMANGRITEIPRGSVRNFRHFAAFRTIEDAKQGCRIVRALLKDMFSTRKNGRK